MEQDKPCLLFCDTFKHDANEDMHLDMVGFSRAIMISEIRVIPQRCKVHPDIRDRLGETTPSSFKLELFCKNLAKPNATVFERLGMFEYEEGKSIQLIVNSKTMTNVILVRGWYRNLTVSLYGNFATFHPDLSHVPPPPPMDARPISGALDGHLGNPVQPNIQQVISSSGISQIPGVQPIYIQTQGIEGQMPPVAIPPHMEHMPYASPGYSGSPQEDFDRRNDRGHFNDYRRDRWQDEGDRPHIRDNRDRFDDDRRTRRDYYDRRGNDNYHRDNRENQERYNEEKKRRDDSVDRRKRDDSFRSETFSEASSQSQTRNTVMPSEELFEPLSPESDFSDHTQDGNNKNSQEKNKEQIGYEDIESDEDIMFEDFDFEDRQNDFDADETWASGSVSFNPYQCSLSPLETISPLTETDFERNVKKYRLDQNSKEPSQLKKLQDFIVSDSEAERDAKWVTMLEELPNIAPTAMAFLRSQPSQKIKERHFLCIITDSAIYALNMENAQTLPLAVNIRFLKAGLKLTCLLASACDDYQRLLIEHGVQWKLVELLKTNHMASSLKLSILKALDVTTNTAYGMERFLGWNTECADKKFENVYEELVLYLLTKPTVRVIAAIKALLQKAHFYESVATLQYICMRITKSPMKQSESEVKKEEDSMEEDADKNEKPTIELDISNKDMNDILTSIENIHAVIDHGNTIIVQPSVHKFPTTARLQENVTEDCYPNVARLLSSRRFLESISILISSPLFCEPLLYVAIRDILFLLMSTHEGLLYLSFDPTVCNGLIRTLLQASESEVEFPDLPTLKQCMMNSDTADGCSPHHLGLLLVYHLQVLQAVDQLLQTAKPDLPLADMDSSDHISMLHTLYAMTFAPIGRDAVAATFSQGNNLESLLPFLTGKEDFESKMKKSVCSRYASILLNNTLLHADRFDYMEKFGSQLLTMPKKENDKLQEDIHYLLSPLEKVTKLDKNTISSLLEFLKNELDDFKIGSGSLRSVISTLRLLKHLLKTTENDDDKQKDLQWRLSVIEMFSSNAIEIFIVLLHKVGEQLLAPWKQNEPFTNNQCFIMVNIALVTLELLNVLLAHSLMTSYCFKDVRLVKELFVLHKILCSKPPAGSLASILTKVRDSIVDLLMKFIKGTKEAPESEEAVKSSTWYINFKELLQFTVAKPENFVTGLVLLSELLPTPLPIHSLQPIKSEQMTKIMNYRLFAMANFSCLGSELKVLIKTVIGSCCSMLQYHLRRVTAQLVDLGPSVAGLLIRSLCEMIDEAINAANKEVDEKAAAAPTEDEADKVQANKRFLSTNIYNVFSLLAYLVCQPGGKASFLNLMSNTDESVTEFPNFIEKLISMKDKDPDVSCIEHHLLPLFQSICDHEVCLKEFSGAITLQHLSNSLPNEDQLLVIVEMLFELLSSDSLPLAALIRVINIMESLTDHDCGMHIIKECLISKEGVLVKFLDRLVQEATSKTNGPAVYSTISTFVEFLNLLTSSGPDNYVKPENADMKTENDVTEMEMEKENRPMIVEKISKNTLLSRSIFIDANMLKAILQLNDKDSSEHALTKLEKILEEDGKDDDELVSLSQAITTLRMIMIAATEPKQTTGNETMIKQINPDSVQIQFNQRLIYMMIGCTEDERAAANDWFEDPPPDDVDSDTENDAVKVDLVAISEKILPNFKFVEEVEKGFVDTTERRSKRSKQVFVRRGEHIEDTKRLRFDVSALNTPASLRGVGRGANRGFTRNPFGRGFGRGRGFRGGFRGRGRGRGADDNFRQRRQNTSRPPSMHVDDFINMEKTGDTVMTHHAEDGKSNTPPPSSNERFPGNYNSSGIGSQGRWNNSQNGFRRSNDGPLSQGQMQRSGGGSGGGGGGGSGPGGYDYNNRSNYGGTRFHNRSNSDWNNSNFRGGSRDSYSRSTRGGGGGYWAGPRQKDDGRFYSGNNFRQNNRGRHQRTFTR